MSESDYTAASSLCDCFLAGFLGLGIRHSAFRRTAAGGFFFSPFFFFLDEGGDTVKSVACQIQCVGTLVVVCISLGVCTSPLLESGTNISET